MKRAWIVVGVSIVAAGLAAVLINSSREVGPSEPRAEEALAPTPMEGMDMSTDGTVRLTPEQLRSFGVTFGTVDRRDLQGTIRTVGIVALDETRIAQVSLKYGGWAERLYADFTGRAVRQGDPLLEVYSPELVSAQEELLLATRLDSSLRGGGVPGVLGDSSRLGEVARRRLLLWDVPEEVIEEALRTEQIRRTITVRSPVSGIVVEKHVLQGQAIEPGEPLYTVADLSRLWVEAELREPDAANVREGSEAVVELAAYPGRPIPGRVSYVYPIVGEEARTFKARVVVANSAGTIKPGMYATVTITGPSRVSLSVPSSAVINTGVRQLVFVDLGAGRLLPQEVQTGYATADYIEVVAGLEPGQRVVTSAQYLLDSESNLAEVMRSMIGQGQSGSGSMQRTESPAGTGMEGMPGMTTPPRER